MVRQVNLVLHGQKKNQQNQKILNLTEELLLIYRNIQKLHETNKKTSH